MAEFAEEKIAKDFKIGNTRVRIATDFCDTMKKNLFIIFYIFIFIIIVNLMEQKN